MSQGTHTTPAAIERLQKVGMSTGGVFLLALAVGFVLDREQFFRVPASDGSSGSGWRWAAWAWPC